MKSGSMKVACYTGLIFGLLAVNIFSGNLTCLMQRKQCKMHWKLFISARMTSFLSVQHYIDPIKTIEDIQNNGLQQFVLGGTSTLDNFIKAKPGTVEKEMWENQVNIERVVQCDS